jgi:hypothetical protein
MKTLKISVVATLASILLWKVRVPHKMWPAHPNLAYFLLAVLLCVVIQWTWSDSETAANAIVGQKQIPENAESKTDVSKSH